MLSGAWFGAWSHDPEIMTWAKIKSWTFSWLSHPGAPYHFNYNVFRCLSLWDHLMWNSLGFLDLDVCFLFQIGERTSHYFFLITSLDFSLSLSLSLSLFRTTIMWMLVCLSQRPPKVFLILLILFFLLLLWVFSIAVSSNSLICASNSSILLLNPSSVCFSPIIIYVWYFVIFPAPMLKFLLCSSILLQDQWTSLWPLLWALYQAGWLLISFH